MTAVQPHRQRYSWAAGCWCTGQNRVALGWNKSTSEHDLRICLGWNRPQRWSICRDGADLTLTTQPSLNTGICVRLLCPQSCFLEHTHLWMASTEMFLFVINGNHTLCSCAVINVILLEFVMLWASSGVRYFLRPTISGLRT